MGFVAGPALGGFLGETDLRLPFLVAAGLSIVNGVYGYVAIPESLPSNRRAGFSLIRTNPFAALSALLARPGAGGLVAVFSLQALALALLETSWVLFTHFRFAWGTRENGIALFCVGLVHAITQGGLLPRLLRIAGDVRLALAGRTSGSSCTSSTARRRVVG